MKILFVDDDKNVLNGLRRSLFNYADKWEMTFCSEGREAMEVLDREQPDIVVTDMRMPHMDGAEVLSMVQKKHPEVVRIVLSGHSELSMVMKSVKPAHQFLSKPCPEEELISTLEHAFQLREIMTDQRVKKIVSGLEELPALPELYVQVREELAREDYSMERVGNLISKDLGMSTTILKLVNSSFFGLRRHVSSPAQAVVLLGSEIVESLILTVKLFSEFKPGSLLNYSINELSQHGVATGAMARVIAQSESQPVEYCDRCFVAGVLHDVGKLILASGFNEEYAEIIGIVQKENRGVRHVEQEFFKTTHAQVGAYLIGLWGFSAEVVQALAFHHTPRESGEMGFSPLTAVHVADALEHEFYTPNPHYSVSEIDMEYLETIGMADRLPAWREGCLKVARTEEPDGQ